MSTAKTATAGLAKIATVIRSHAWKGAAPAGVTPTQGQALALLRASPAGMRLGPLATALGVSAPTASEAVGALVSKGFVLKEPGPDKRSVTLKLTPRGLQVAELTNDWPEFLTRAIETLPPADQSSLLRMVMQIISAMQTNGAISPQRHCASCQFFRSNAYPGSDKPHHCAFVDNPFGDAELRLECGDYESKAAGA